MLDILQRNSQLRSRSVQSQMPGVPKLQSSNLDCGKMTLVYKIAVHSEWDGSDPKHHGSAVLCQLWGPCGLHPGPGALWFLLCPHQSPLFFSQTEAFADVPLSELWPSALLRSIAPGEDFWPPPVCSTPKCQFPAPQPSVLLLDPVDSSASASFLYILMKVDFNLYSYGIFLSSISTCFVCVFLFYNLKGRHTWFWRRNCIPSGLWLPHRCV